MPIPTLRVASQALVGDLPHDRLGVVQQGDQVRHKLREVRSDRIHATISNGTQGENSRRTVRPLLVTKSILLW